MKYGALQLGSMSQVGNDDEGDEDPGVTCPKGEQRLIHCIYLGEGEQPHPVSTGVWSSEM